MENLPQIKETKSSQNGNFLATKIVKAHSCPKIRELNPQEFETIEQCFRYVFLLIGLRPENQPSGAESSVLAKFVLDYLSHYTTEDIRLAYELAVAKKLKVDARCFQSFSSQYLGEIMAAYSVHMENAMAEARRQEEKERLAAEKIYSEKEIKQIDESFYQEMVVYEYLNFLETGNYNIMPVSAKLVYSSMLKRGLITLTEAEKKDIYEHEKSKIIEAKMESPIKLEDFITTEEINTAKNRFWLRVIDMMFHKMKAEGVVLK